MNFVPSHQTRWLPVIAAAASLIASTVYPGIMIVIPLGLSAVFLLLALGGARGSSVAYWLTLPFCAVTAWVSVQLLTPLVTRLLAGTLVPMSMVDSIWVASVVLLAVASVVSLALASLTILSAVWRRYPGQ